MSGESNPDYEQTYVFANDFPALTPDVPDHSTEDVLFASHAEQGECRVVAYSPRHDRTLAELNKVAIAQVIDTWVTESEDLGQHYPWVQVFENKGEIMGCSMPHPHGQIWAQQHAPTLLDREDELQASYCSEQGALMLLDYAQREQADGERTVVENDDWLAVVPYWAAWPFEVLLLPLFKVPRLSALADNRRMSLADVLSALLIRYDNLFECSFPYSMGWHGAPYGLPGEHWQLHAHFYPPLLRSQSVRKFMVGYEMLAEPQRDLTPEQAAAVLRDLPATHYKDGSRSG